MVDESIPVARASAGAFISASTMRSLRFSDKFNIIIIPCPAQNQPSSQRNLLYGQDFQATACFFPPAIDKKHPKKFLFLLRNDIAKSQILLKLCEVFRKKAVPVCNLSLRMDIPLTPAKNRPNNEKIRSNRQTYHNSEPACPLYRKTISNCKYAFLRQAPFASAPVRSSALLSFQKLSTNLT